MVTYELWFDESGEFEDQYLTESEEASLVGGVLVADEAISYPKATEILGKKDPRGKSHECEDKNPTRQVERIRNIFADREKCIPVIFQNAEKKSITNDKYTYLNVCAEGIAKLYCALATKNKEFEFTVVIAKRTSEGVGNNRSLISKDDYQRIKERISIEMLRLGIYDGNTEKWINSTDNIILEDAREDSRLQLCDTICNAYLTRKSGKFQKEQREILEHIFDKTTMYYYPVLCANEHETVEYLYNCGQLGEALFVCLFAEDIHDWKELADNIIVPGLCALKYDMLSQQLNIIEKRIDAVTKYKTNYEKQKEALKYIQDVLLPKLERNKLSYPLFAFNCTLYLYDILSHMGSSEGTKQYGICSLYLNDIQDMYQKLTCYTRLETRHSIDLKNMFEYAKSKKAIDGVIQANILIKEALQNHAELKKLVANKNYLLACAYGTRQQLWPLLYAEADKNDILDSAKNDYEQAIKNFTTKEDMLRQYIYYAQSLTAAGDFVGAVGQLLLVEGYKENNAANLKVYLQGLKNKWKNDLVSVAYQYLGLFRIIVKALEKNDAYGVELWKAFDKFKPENLFTIENTGKNSYPLNMIYWLYGECLRLQPDFQQEKSAIYYFDLAYDLDKNPGLTIKFLMAGMLASKILQEPNNKEYKSAFNQFKTVNFGSIGQNVKQYWKCVFDNQYADVVRKAKLIS